MPASTLGVAAGPGLFGQLRARGLVQQLFLTVSPLVAGRDGDIPPGLVGGTRLLPGIGQEARLLSLERHGSYLLLRYRFVSWRRTRDPPALYQWLCGLSAGVWSNSISSRRLM